MSEVKSGIFHRVLICITERSGLAIPEAIYQEKLRQHHLEPSMSRKGNCLDNAVMESFFGILKSEGCCSSDFTDIQQLKSAINAYIHYCNNERIKLNLNGLSPGQYRTQAISITAGNVRY